MQNLNKKRDSGTEGHRGVFSPQQFAQHSSKWITPIRTVLEVVCPSALHRSVLSRTLERPCFNPLKSN